ncbi:CMRF35-like molecule 8 [Pygocentrus nattereri]|uniref:CMRF35-like molecule 8 n=1 Tax=Pygocentrus nattereri TaxID=42514 RepID=UPI001890FCD2|nr:CMRF35-like molecule 8 [Pygocentrus nattereri]
MNLTIKEDPCCLSPNTVAGYLGETVTISCSYPEEFERNTKLFYKWTGEDFLEVIDTTVTLMDRFSISDDRRSKVLRVRISDVREDDGGVYYCGAEERMGSISYKSFFTEIQLQVSEGKETTATASTTASVRTTATGKTPAAFEEHFTFSMIITACACVALLLIGGSAITYYKLRCEKTQESSFIRKRSGTNEMVGEWV